VTTTPVTTTPYTTQAVTTTPVTTKPVTTQAYTTQAVTTTPVTTTPYTTQAVTTTPVTTTPVTTQVYTTECITTEAVTTQAVTTQPVTTQPVTTQPYTTQAYTTQAVTTTPVTTQPYTTQAYTTQAVTTKPIYPVTTGAPVPPPPPPPPPVIPPYQTDCDTNGQGHFFGSVPSLFNVFVFEDFYCLNSDTQGRLAAGGNITIEHYAVGCEIYPPPVPGSTCIEYGSLTCVDAIATGDWVDNLVAGGSLTATSSQLWIGNVVYGTTLNSDFTFNFQQDCYIQQEHPIDFAVWEVYEQQLSAKLCAMTTTGTDTVEEGWKLVLHGTGATVDVFSIQGSDLCGPNIRGFDIEGTGNSTVIINVHGDSLDCGGYTMGFSTPPYNAAKVLFNFCEATSITLSAVQWRGSILAPWADITPINGAISGQIIAKSFVSHNKTCLQQDWVQFEGCIPDACLNVNPRPYCTETQDKWDDSCPLSSIDTSITERTPVTGACCLDLAFDTCYGQAGVSVGCVDNGYFLALTSAEEIRAFLPQTDSTNIAPFTEDYLNPSTTSAGAAAGELVSLVLATGFDKCLADQVGLCSLFDEIYICGLTSGADSCDDFYGYTIGELVAEANQVIGGCPAAGAHSIQTIYSCLKTVNAAFLDCKTISAPAQPASYCPCDQKYCSVQPLSIQEMTTDNAGYSSNGPVNTEVGIEGVSQGNGLFASLVLLLVATLVALL
jgi:choice-of-anchor A domain-containing protein